MTETNADTTGKGRKARVRSPGYPYINLEDAIARAKKFHEHESRSSANYVVALRHWGYGKKSSVGRQVLAAVKAFGLFEDEGAGELRRVKLTGRALLILLDDHPNSADRIEALQEAALAPKIHQIIWENEGERLPSDVNLRHYLLFDHDPPFNENTVGQFIQEFRATLEFASLLESGNIPPENGDTEEDLMKQSQTRTPTPPAPPKPPPGTQDYPVPLGVDENGQLQFAYVQFAGAITKVEIETIREALDELKKKLK